nr:tumor necrosis factor receptor superfamily member 12A isoform X1 [Macaca nemestrina]
MARGSLRRLLRLLVLGLWLALLRSVAGEQAPGTRDLGVGEPRSGAREPDWVPGEQRGTGGTGGCTAPCSRGSSWSADLDKCMDCASCRARPHSDFCLGCAAAPPAPFRLLWPILGGALSLTFVLGLLSGFLVWRRCRRREKFTTPIEETGGEGCPAVALIQ